MGGGGGGQQHTLPPPHLPKTAANGKWMTAGSGMAVYADGSGKVLSQVLAIADVAGPLSPPAIAAAGAPGGDDLAFLRYAQRGDLHERGGVMEPPKLSRGHGEVTAVGDDGEDLTVAMALKMTMPSSADDGFGEDLRGIMGSQLQEATPASIRDVLMRLERI